MARATTELQPRPIAAYGNIPSGARDHAEAPWLSQFAPGTKLLGIYTVISILGRGGMGIVLRAAHTDSSANQPDVAIKVLYGAASRSPEMRVRLFREARIVKELTSPHVAAPSLVGVLDTGEPYIVMEWLEGEDLASYLAREQTVPLEQAIAWTLQICAALKNAHSRGIVHRDLKPSNIFLQRQEGAPSRIKLLDFGISKRFEPGEHAGSATEASEHLSLTKAHTLLGTPAYMAPEQVHNARDVGPAADVWSVGVLFCELVNGKSPFAKASLGGTLAAVLTEPTPELAVPAAIQALIAQCLQKDPTKRFADASALLDAWSLVQNTPDVVPMRRPSTRWGAVTVAVVALGIGASAWALVPARRSEPPVRIATAQPLPAPSVPQSTLASTTAATIEPTSSSKSVLDAKARTRSIATAVPAAKELAAPVPSSTTDDTAVVFGARQ